MSKEEFVKRLKDLFFDDGNRLGLADIKYVKTQFCEWVYLIYKDNSQKRFSVEFDNNMAILKDFVNFINNKDMYRWLEESEKV